MVLGKPKLNYCLKNWKIGIHLLFRTKRFGVNNEWWSKFDSIFGVSIGQILWDTVRIWPIIRNYKMMKFRVIKLHFMSTATRTILWPRDG